MATRASSRLQEKFRMRLSLRRCWPEFVTFLVLAECVGAVATAYRFGVSNEIPWMSYFGLWLGPVVAGLLIVTCHWFFALYRAANPHPLAASWNRLLTLEPRRCMEVVVPALLVAPFIASFTTLKTLLVNTSTRTIDAELARIDGLVGIQPWQVSHLLIGPAGTLLLDRIYLSWLFVTQLTFVAIIFAPRLRHLRAQVLVTAVLVWIVVGTVMAAAMPSVGPCYFGLVEQSDLYGPLRHRLETISAATPLSSLGIQKALWEFHEAHRMTVGSGVSAMPSMHVAMATVQALLLRRLGAGWVAWMWPALIWIGSVHLGWHYASDGVVALIAAGSIWIGVGWLLGEGADPTRLARAS